MLWCNLLELVQGKLNCYNDHLCLCCSCKIKSLGWLVWFWVSLPAIPLSFRRTNRNTYFTKILSYHGKLFPFDSRWVHRTCTKVWLYSNSIWLVQVLINSSTCWPSSQGCLGLACPTTAAMSWYVLYLEYIVVLSAYLLVFHSYDVLFSATSINYL